MNLLKIVLLILAPISFLSASEALPPVAQAWYAWARLPEDAYEHGTGSPIKLSADSARSLFDQTVTQLNECLVAKQIGSLGGANLEAFIESGVFEGSDALPVLTRDLLKQLAFSLSYLRVTARGVDPVVELGIGGAEGPFHVLQYYLRMERFVRSWADGGLGKALLDLDNVFEVKVHSFGCMMPCNPLTLEHRAAARFYRSLSVLVRETMISVAEDFMGRLGAGVFLQKALAFCLLTDKTVYESFLQSVESWGCVSEQKSCLHAAILPARFLLADPEFCLAGYSEFDLDNSDVIAAEVARLKERKILFEEGAKAEVVRYVEAGSPDQYQPDDLIALKEVLILQSKITMLSLLANPKLSADVKALLKRVLVV